MLRIKPTRVIKSDAEWRRILTPEQHRVLRQKSTALPFEAAVNKDTLRFDCAACSLPVYSIRSYIKQYKKVDPWFVFEKCFRGAAVAIPDRTFGKPRMRMVCGACESHLGHVYHGEGITITNERHTINPTSVTQVAQDAPNLYIVAEGKVLDP
eukprot:PhM_4_TR11823/c0_g1_i1/m.7973/K07305/msrB; peptide-methionine (R)-S-oxide reductase